MNVLVFSGTTGYRHDSIPAGVRTLRHLGVANGLGITATEDLDHFTTAGLRGYAAVVFLNTSGDLFAEAHRTAFADYLHRGGGFVGVHCAAHTETRWPDYAAVVGARFTDHPAIQPATLRVQDHAHPATAHLGRDWYRTDEWYNFDHGPVGPARILLSVDESSYTGGTMPDGHPIAWCYEPRPGLHGGRAFYTALGHTIEGYAEPAMQAHLLGAVAWATGIA